MNAPTKSAPIQRGDLSAEEAERFASLFRPVWDLDDAPFSAARPAMSPSDVQQLGKAGIVPDVQLAQNGSFAAAGPHAPPAAQLAPEAPDASIVVDVDPDPTPPPPARPAVPQNRPAQAKPAVPPAPVSRPRRSAPPGAVRAQLGASDDDLAPAKKSSAGLFIGLGVVALLVVGGVAYKAIGGNKTDEVKPTPTETTTARVEPRIPPPPPAVDTTAETPKIDTPATTAKIDTPAATAKIDPPVVTTAKIDPPPPPPKNTATAVATTPPKPPPPKNTATNGGTKPPPKGPGGGIVRDNPF